MGLPLKNSELTLDVTSSLNSELDLEVVSVGPLDFTELIIENLQTFIRFFELKDLVHG